MKILVANLGSTSCKYCLFEMPADRSARDEREIARGQVERVGSSDVPDHAVAMQRCLDKLTAAGCLAGGESLDAVGFKAVHGGGVWAAARVDDEVLAVMDEYADIAPAHNPVYTRAMRALRQRWPDVPQVACFETGFHRAIPLARQLYAVPYEWIERLGIRRYGFHGASHRYVGEAVAARLGRPDARVIACHLGGSSSICAIAGGRSVATSMGLSAQSGLPQGARVGDFDAYGLIRLTAKTGQSAEALLAMMARQGGLLGLSGVGTDMRDIEAAAAAGDERAELAIAAFVSAARDYIGAYAVELGGVDAIAFTGGIGQNSVAVRGRICAGMEWMGVELDARRNAAVRGDGVISSDASKVRVEVLTTDEELVVARQTRDVLLTGENQ